ncbi:MAG: hypothetical protein DDT42_01710 [candidate division WS2 bacterium]|uniref:Uncharacterized protein n=1 Tax=Psychracetigena formicireducens TaxID=2986056 RepID=A0A9E2BHV2_PSYF1|nr:hypothetical protein [Candidatus Psychracetigena formicireducens]
MLFFPDVYRYEVVPWPDRIFPGGPFPPAPADYRMQLLHNFAAFQDMHNQTEIKWDTGTRGIGILVSDTLGWQQGGPAGSTMDSFHGLFLPLIKRGIPAEIVPIERIGDAGYLDEFKVLLLSYDMWKPLYEVYHQYLRDWVKEGGVLLFFGGADEYNKVQEWWRESGYERPQDHLLETLGIKIESAKELTTPTVPGMHVLKAGIENNLTRKLVKLGVAPKFAEEGLIIPGGEEEVPYLYEVGGSGGSWRGVRFADKYGYFTYQFILPGARAASVELTIGNNYLVKISGDMRTWTEVLRAEPEYAEGDVALKNLGPRTINLTPHIGKNGVVYLRFLDASTHDGWGPYLAGVDLKIEGEVKKPESLPGDSFGISPRYTLMGYKTSDTVSLFSTQEGYKVIWEKELGRGAFIYAGVPSKFFAHHRNNAQVLRELVRYACEKGGILYEEQHYVKLRRGKYAIVRALDGAVSVPGKYLNLFGYDLPVVIDPSFLPGQGGLLYDISGYSDYDVPRILFSSLRLVQKNETRETTSFTIHSAQGTTAVCRIYGGKHFPKSIKAYQQNQPWPVDSIWNSDTKTLLIKFDGHVGGIKVEINWSEQKKGI